jgi:hemolysin activation/secretion protein
MAGGWVRISCALVAGWLAALSSSAQDNPTFPIRGYQIEGNSLLPQAQMSLTVMPFTGAKSSFETIQLALEALEKAYLAAGFGSVKIEVPEQDLQDGVVKLQVVEARLASIVVQGQKNHSEANVLRTLPALRIGEVVNLNTLQRNLDLANESAAKHTSVTFRQSEATAKTDALVRVNEDEPIRVVATIDNTGNESTGKYRTGVSVVHSNVFDRDHVLSMQVLTSPSHVDKVAIVGLGYHVPLYGLGDSLDFTLGYSNVDSGKTDLFSVSGGGLIAGVRYNQNLTALGDWQHKVSYALDQRSYGNSVVPLGGGASLVPDLLVRPLSITYSGNQRSAKRELSASATYTYNLESSGNGSTAAFNQPGGRAGANASFSTLKLSASWVERMSLDWTVRSALSTQYTNDLLISAEQFGAGGADSVRGLNEREVAADNGVRMGVELWGPDMVAGLAGKLGGADKLKGLRISPVAFADAAWVRFNVAPGSIAGQAVSSVGLGLRGNFERSATFKIDWGYVVQGAEATGPTASAKGAWRWHGNAAWFF